MIRKLLFGIVAVLFSTSLAHAQAAVKPCVEKSNSAGGITSYNCQPVTAANPLPVAGPYLFNVAGSTITRPNDVTAYTASSSAPQTVCAAKTVTACVPGTIAIAAAANGNVTIARVTLLKSGSATASANFQLWFYAGAPRVASPTQFDATGYTGPRAADLPNYIGNATCSTPVATSDTTAQVWYECALSNPNMASTLIAQAINGSININYLLTVNAPYTPAANEMFTPYVSGLY